MWRQWIAASGYLSVLVLPMLLVVGVAIDKPYLAFGVAMLVFPLARGVFGRYAGPTVWREGIATALHWLPVLYGAVLAAALVLLLSQIANGALTTTGQWIGLVLSLWMVLLFATCPAHDLIHRRSGPQARVGHLIAGLAGYPLLSFEHLRHHARPGETSKAEAPRVDESVWHFAWRRIASIAVMVLRNNAAKRRQSRIPIRRRSTNEALLLCTIAWAAFAATGGVAGFLTYLAAIIGVTVGIQIITYLQHWGLGDDNLADAARGQYAWENDCLFEAWVTLHINFHQSHHRKAHLPFYRLPMTSDSPRLPAGYVVLMILCLFPRLWQQLMLPVLAHWKQQPQQPRSVGRRLSCFNFYGPGVD